MQLGLLLLQMLTRVSVGRRITLIQSRAELAGHNQAVSMPDIMVAMPVLKALARLVQIASVVVAVAVLSKDGNALMTIKPTPFVILAIIKPSKGRPMLIIV